MRQAYTVRDPAESLVDAGGDVFARSNDGDRFENLIADQVCHVVPLAFL